MSPKSSLYLYLFFPVVLACQPKVAPSALDTSTTEGDYSSCFKQTKAQILAAAAVQNTAAANDEDDAEMFNSIILSGKAADMKFERSMQNNTDSAISLTRSFTKDTKRVTTAVEVGITDPGSDSLPTYLEMTVATSLFEQNLRQRQLIQTYRINVASGCKSSLVKVQSGQFHYGQTVQLDITTRDLLNNLTDQVSTAIPLPAMQNDSTMDPAALDSLLGPVNSRRLLVFNDGSFDPVTQDIYLERKSAQTQLDPFLGKEVPFNLFAFTVYGGDQALFQGEMFLSTASAYQRTSYTMASMAGLTESLTQQRWQDQQLATQEELDHTKNFKIDLSQPEVTYQVTSGTLLPFDNYANYFGFVQLNPVIDAQGRSLYTYQVTRHKDFTLPPEMGAIFDPAAGAQFADDLAESYYINISDPKIQQAIADIHQALPQPTYEQLVQKIADFVVGAIKYDYAELSNDSTVIMRASDALQRQSGVCQHFAAVFVSLARGLKLPARVIEGYHLSDMPDGSVKAGGHAWVEVLIAGKVWLPIEPQSNDAYSIQKYFPMEYFPIAPMQAYNSKDGIVSENFKDAMAIMAMLGLSFKN